MPKVSIQNRLNYLVSLAKTEPYKFEKEMERESLKEIEEGKEARQNEKYDEAVTTVNYIVNYLTQKIEDICRSRGLPTGKTPLIVPITAESAKEVVQKFKEFFKVSFPIFEITEEEFYTGIQGAEYEVLYFLIYNKNKLLYIFNNTIEQGDYEFPSGAIQFIDQLLDINNFPEWKPYTGKDIYRTLHIKEEEVRTRQEESALKEISKKFPKCFTNLDLYTIIPAMRDSELKKLYSSDMLNLLGLIENSKGINFYHTKNEHRYQPDIPEIESEIKYYITFDIIFNLNEIFESHGLKFNSNNSNLWHAVSDWSGGRTQNITADMFKKIKFYLQKIKNLFDRVATNKHLLPRIGELLANSNVHAERMFKQMLNMLDSLSTNDIINLIFVSKNLHRKVLVDRDGFEFVDPNFELKKYSPDNNEIKKINELFTNLNVESRYKFIKNLLSNYYGERLSGLLTESLNKKNIIKIIEYMVNAWKKDANFAEKAGVIILQMPYQVLNNIGLAGRVVRAIEIVQPKNENEIISLFNKVKEFEDLAHNEGSTDVSIFDAVIKHKYDLKSDDVKKIIILIMKTRGNVLGDRFLEKFEGICKAFGYNPGEEFDNLNTINTNFDSGILTKDKSIVNKLNNIISNFEIGDALERLNPLRKDKDKKLFMLNYNVNNNLVFEVLSDRSVEHFTVGAETDCCQKMGDDSPGEPACIDSYINSLAGVLVLRHPSGIIAQSYFHYVPEDNGIILDNVEVNWKRCNAAKIDVNAVYAALAKQATADYNLSYFRCGMRYNDLKNDLFSTTKLNKDPRHFEYDASNQDFSYQHHIDLLNPKFVKETYTLSKQSSKRLPTWIKVGRVDSLVDTYYYNAVVA